MALYLHHAQLFAISRKYEMSPASFTIRSDTNIRTIALSGDWTSLTMGNEVTGLLAAIGATSDLPLRLDIRRLGQLDTAGAYVILRAMSPAVWDSDIASRPDVTHLFALVRPTLNEQTTDTPRSASPYYFFAQIGRGVVWFGRESVHIAAFAGELSAALARTIRHPGRLRLIALARVIETSGINALPVVLILNFFVGAVLALVGASLLGPVGIRSFTPEIVGVTVLREFGVLMTGILLAARSASSFAAQLGAMKITQELDALKVMGDDQFDALIVPRVLALILVMPLLVPAAIAAGISGGLIVSSLVFDISPAFFLARLADTVDVDNFWIGISKVPLFALLIASAGCRHGLFVRGDVENLGIRVTRAVVQAIFMVILFDAIFAVIYARLHL
jgi:phospholipid/cholesterol/gamma-HCH transport system permease protein